VKLCIGTKYFLIGKIGIVDFHLLIASEKRLKNNFF
jgi:hypothetical protein